MLFKIATLVLVMSISSNSSAQQKYYYPPEFEGWTFVCLGTNGDHWYIKNEPVNKEYGEIKVWFKTLTVLKINKKIYKHVEGKELLVIKCKAKQSKTISTIYYSSTGKILLQKETSSASFEDVIPNSVGELLLNKACELFNK